MPFANALMQLAEPRPVGDHIKVAIGRAARAAGLSYARTFNIWYGRARRIDAHEAEQIQQALQAKREEEARNEIHDLRARLLKMESRFAAEAANSGRPGAGFLRPSVSGGGGAGGSLASKR